MNENKLPGDMNMENVEIKHGDVLLGCKWLVRNGKLISLERDLFKGGTKYYYINTSKHISDFNRDLAETISKEASQEVMEDVRIVSQCVYIPTLRCGDRLLSLNTVQDDFVLSQYFSGGTMDLKPFGDVRLLPLSEGCIDVRSVQIREVNLSVREADYLVSYYNLNNSSEMEVVFVPFFIASISTKTRRFEAAQPGFVNVDSIQHDFPAYDDFVFASVLQVLFCLLFYSISGIILYNHWGEFVDVIGGLIQSLIYQQLYLGDIFILLALLDRLLSLLTLVFAMIVGILSAIFVALGLPGLLAVSFSGLLRWIRKKRVTSKNRMLLRKMIG